MDQTIVVQKTFIEYNAINLTGEVGGTLGMGLGWSVFFFWELLIGLVTKDRTRRMKLNWFGFMSLFWIFIYWSSGAVMDFHYVVDSLMQYSDNDELPTPILLSLNNSTTLARSLWTKVFHEKHGVCYTLDAKNWER